MKFNQKKIIEAVSNLKYLDRKFVIRVAVHYGVVLVFSALFVLPSCGKGVKYFLEIDKLKVDTAKNSAVIAQGAIVQKDLTKQHEQINEVEKRFFLDDELPKLLSIIASLAKKNSINLISTKALYGSEGKPFNKYYVEHAFLVNLSGGYHDFGMFLSDLKREAKLLKVRKINIAAIPQTPGKHDIRMELGVYAKAVLQAPSAVVPKSGVS